MTVSRGTSNSNERGSSYERRARKHYLLLTFESEEGEGTVYCYRCPTLLDWFTLTVDRIVPGCLGGKYVRTNIRPACARCNTETGAAMANARRLIGLKAAARRREAARKGAATRRRNRRLEVVA